jgi:hypothetical protein
MTISIPELKKTDEYKMWSAMIRKDYPSMLESQIDLAIWAHKHNPRAYQNEYKDRKDREREGEKIKPIPDVTQDFVKIYESADDLDLPSAIPFKSE